MVKHFLTSECFLHSSGIAFNIKDNLITDPNKIEDVNEYSINITNIQLGNN